MVYVFLFLAGCFPELNGRYFVDDPDHDYDGDNFTERQGDCDDNNSEVNAERTWYADADGDGYGNAAYELFACYQPEGYRAIQLDENGYEIFDCDDSNRLVFPGAAEVCDQADNDCNSLVDEDDIENLLTNAYWYRDADGDGYGNPELVITDCDPQQGYVQGEENLAIEHQDCDDSNPIQNPSQVEVCDGIDNDCDGEIDGSDDDVLPDRIWYIDEDGDGHGSNNTNIDTIASCEEPEGYAGVNDDCNDSEESVHPGALELCDGIDQNCNIQVDEGTRVTWYRDEDEDGYGAIASVTASIEDCPDSNPVGYVLNNDDCNDDVTVGGTANPNLPELCDGIDNDCDTLIDEPDSLDAITWYPDYDNDGFGADSGTIQRCQQPTGHVSIGGDCNDGRSNVNPNELETCTTGYDDNCDNDSNDLNAINCTNYYYDYDGDGYGDASQLECRCNSQGQFSSNNGEDCDDQLAAVSPIAVEDCNTNYDDNCDGFVDSLGAGNCIIYYYDYDGDGHGTEQYECWCQPNGVYSALSLDDCDDEDAEVSPSEIEVCDALDVDENCDGIADGADAVGAVAYYLDDDSDGFGNAAAILVQCDAPEDYVLDSTDCDDSRDLVNPTGIETCSTIYDDDCDGNDNDDGAIGCSQYWADVDLDLFGDPNDVACLCQDEGVYTARNETDCDDGEVLANPDMGETCATAYDDNCDGDINEEDASTCTEYFYDYDGDGYGVSSDGHCYCNSENYYSAVEGGDCNDADPTVNLGAGNCGLLEYIDNDEALHSAEMQMTGGREGWDLATNFDYNGDGNPDLAFSNPNYDTTYTNPGQVYVFYAPFPATLQMNTPVNADVIIDPQGFGLFFGKRMTGGDFDGDGIAELLVETTSDTYLLDYTDISSGTYDYTDSTAVFSGMTCFSPLGDVNADGAMDVMTHNYCSQVGLETNGGNIYYGTDTLATTGFIDSGLSFANGYGHKRGYGQEPWDYNGDGINDFAVYDFGTGSDIYLGGTAFDLVADESIPVEGTINQLQDFNGDGYGDLAVADSWANYDYYDPFSGNQTMGNVGKTWILRGGDSAVPTAQPDTSETDAMMVIRKTYANARLASPRGVGDINGDGHSDLILHYTYQGTHPGDGDCGILFYGQVDTGSVQIEEIATDADAAFEAESLKSFFACSITQEVHTVGDINQDGNSDFLLINQHIYSSTNMRPYIFAGAQNGN
jgi:hypothetical protein